MKPLVIFGIGEIADIACYYFREDSPRAVAAFTVDAAYVESSTAMGLPVIPFETVADAYPPEEYDLFVAVGYGGLNTLRQRKIEEAEAKRYTLASYVSSRANVWNGFVVEPNVLILEANTLQPHVRVGRGTTLWSGNHIGHHSHIGDYCFLASHVVVSGGVSIGNHSFVGVNVTLRDHISIGQRCVIGAGCLLLKDAPDESVFAGTASAPSPVPSSRLRSL